MIPVLTDSVQQCFGRRHIAHVKQVGNGLNLFFLRQLSESRAEIAKHVLQRTHIAFCIKHGHTELFKLHSAFTCRRGQFQKHVSHVRTGFASLYASICHSGQCNFKLLEAINRLLCAVSHIDNAAVKLLRKTTHNKESIAQLFYRRVASGCRFCHFIDHL